MAISAVCNEASLATGISGGIGAVMFLVQMIRNTQISDTVEKFKYFTFFTLYNPGKIADNVESGFIGIAVLGVLGLLFYFFSVILFEKKDLPIWLKKQENNRKILKRRKHGGKAYERNKKLWCVQISW